MARAISSQYERKNLPMDLDERAGRIYLTFLTQSAWHLRNRLDVNDFATPVKYIDARMEDGNTVVMIEPQGGYDYLAWQSGDMLTVSVRALTAQEEREEHLKASYTGDKLSLNFQDIEIRAVLQILADFKDSTWWPVMLSPVM